MYPLIISLVGLLLIVMIGYNIIQQYKQKAETERRISVSKQHATITEVDELLLFSTKIPFSKALLLILKNRIRNALYIMINISPTTASYREHFADTEAQIKQIKENYVAPSPSSLQVPPNDKDAMALVQATKKIRAVLRSEHAKQKINTDLFVSENQQLEMMQLKINIEISIKRINDAKGQKQYNTAKQMTDKILKILNNLPNKDSDLEHKQQMLESVKNELSAHLTSAQKIASENQAQEQKDDAKRKDLDRLFADKQKW
ncbi:DNA repair ATPase [Psychromonas sp. B3M02]|uniref:DNA repair ATPase n=1 Tax=Psychromonas sp. B3M02 TaxID=2267226 RepID=UPI00215D901D|nr:DNA repair ATPase [Psychromonas sp. B3M02]